MADPQNDGRVVSPPPYKVPMFNRDGTPVQVWATWFRQVWLRIGKEIALNNVQLENLQQEDLTQVQADITALQSDVATVAAVNNVQNTRLTALEAEVEGLKLGPVP